MGGDAIEGALVAACSKSNSERRPQAPSPGRGFAARAGAPRDAAALGCCWPREEIWRRPCGSARRADAHTCGEGAHEVLHRPVIPDVGPMAARRRVLYVLHGCCAAAGGAATGGNVYRWAYDRGAR